MTSIAPRRFALLLAGFLCLAGAAGALAQPHALTTQSQPAFDTGRPLPEFHKLDNGLRICIVEDHTLPLVSVQLWYRAGSIDNAPSQAGLTHVLRSYLAHRDAAAETAEALGLEFESRTLWDACYFMTTLPREYLDIALDFEAARMRPAKLTSDEFRAALNSAARETHLSFASNAELLEPPAERDRRLIGKNGTKHLEIERRILATLFGEHPYSRPPEFVSASLADASLNDVNDFARRWFVPGAATLFVVGDVSAPRALDAVQRKFGPLQWSEPPRRPARDALDPAFCEIVDGKEHYLAWRLGSTLSPESAGLRPLVNGFLQEELGGEWRLVRGAEASVLLFHPRPNLIRISSDEKTPGTATQPSSSGAVVTVIPADTAASRISDLLRSLTQTIPSEITWNLARRFAWRDLIEPHESFPHRALALASSEIIGGDALLAEFEERQVLHMPIGELTLAATVLAEALEQRRSEPTASPPAGFAPRSSDVATNVVKIPDRPALTAVSPPEGLGLSKEGAFTRCAIPGFPRAWIGIQPDESVKTVRRRTEEEFPLSEYLDYCGIAHELSGSRAALWIPLDSQSSATELSQRVLDQMSTSTPAAEMLPPIVDFRLRELEIDILKDSSNAWFTFIPRTSRPELDQRLTLALDFLLGGSHEENLSGNGGRANVLDFRWHTETEIPGAIRSTAIRLARLATAKVPDAEVAGALAKAQVVARIRLDSPATIGLAALGGVSNPWELTEVTPTEFVAWLREALIRQAPKFVVECRNGAVWNELSQMRHTIADWAAMPD